MKKLSFLFGAAVIMMTSCSNDEVVDVATTQVIGFNSFVNNSTRATGTATDLIAGSTFTDFDVWAVKWNDAQAPNQVFIQQQVNLEGAEWKYGPLRYWVAGDNYRFTALAPSKAKGVTVTQSTDPITNFEDVHGGLIIDFNNGDNGAEAAVDLCIATNKLQNASAAQEPVQLQFSHMLSRVKFTFLNAFEAEQSVLKIENVKITNAVDKAKLNSVLGETLWTADGGTTFGIDFTLNPTSGVDHTVINGGGQTQDTKHQYVIPIKDEKTYQVSFTVTMSTYDVTKKTFTTVGTWNHAVDLPVKQFVNNYSYNFVAKLDATNVNPDEQMRPIEFNPSVTPWDDFNSTDNPEQELEHTH